MNPQVIKSSVYESHHGLYNVLFNQNEKNMLVSAQVSLPTRENPLAA